MGLVCIKVRTRGPFSCHDGRIGLRISAIFVILIGSTIGAVAPILLARTARLPFPRTAFFTAKYSAAAAAGEKGLPGVHGTIAADGVNRQYLVDNPGLDLFCVLRRPFVVSRPIEPP